MSLVDSKNRLPNNIKMNSRLVILFRNILKLSINQLLNINYMIPSLVKKINNALFRYIDESILLVVILDSNILVKIVYYVS